MVIRTFLDKNNTIVYGQKYNTGKNPVTELFYGGGGANKNFSRFLFEFNLDRLISFRNKGMYPDLSGLTHTLNMTATSTFDASLLGGVTSDGKDRTSSFDLHVFKINQPWDEGVGNDFNGQRYFTSDNSNLINENPSNWFDSNTGTNWSLGNGVFSNWDDITIINSQHFEDGNENLQIDITSAVNNILTGDTNYGFGIAFSEGLENTISDNTNYVGFFTRHTQTFFEPFIETRYNKAVLDDRGKFYLDKLNKLYLYINVGGIPTDADSIGGVIVNDNNGDLFSAFTSSEISHESQGIYSIELIVPTNNFGCTLYEDIWTGITINGVIRPNVTLEFELKDSNEYYNIGDSSELPKKYTFNVFGIKDNEKINRGDIRKVSVMARIPYTVDQQEVLDLLEYRLYIKEGSSEYTVIDYTSVNLAFNYNYFLLDTASLVPQTYYLDIKSISNYEVNTIKDVIKFHITNQIDNKNN